MTEVAQAQILSHTHGGQINHVTDDQVGELLVPRLPVRTAKSLNERMMEALTDRKGIEHIGERMAEVTDKSVVVYLIPRGKIRCCVTGNLYKDTPEENVRQRWARSLMDEYGYPQTDLGIEVGIKMGRKTKRADLVIYQHDAERIQENIMIIVEAKREDVLPSDKNEGIDQVKSYMAASMSCRYGLWWARSASHSRKRKMQDSNRSPTYPDSVSTR